MSYILDALKRSDLHRELVNEPSAPSAERAAVLQIRGFDVSRLAPLLMAVAALGAAAMLTLHSSPDGATLSAPALESAPPAKAAAPATPKAAAASAPAASAARAARPAEALKPPVAATPAARTTPQPATISAARTASPPPPARSTAGADTAEDGPAPLFADLPLSERQAIPHLHVDVHTWAESPKKRFVMLNGQIYHQGDTTHEGPVVERIEPDGVVLSYRGRRYKLLR